MSLAFENYVDIRVDGICRIDRCFSLQLALCKCCGKYTNIIPDVKKHNVFCFDLLTFVRRRNLTWFFFVLITHVVLS